MHISPDFNYSCGASKHVYSLLSNFSQLKYCKVFFFTNSGDALEKLEIINVIPGIFRYSTGIRNIYNLSYNLKTIKAFCTQNNIDIIHTHHRYPEFLASIISRQTGIKTITTVHSLVKGKTRISFKSDRIIAVSEAVKKMLIDYYNIPDEKITTLYNFIEPFPNIGNSELVKIRSNLNVAENNKIILFIGRVSKIKGVDLLIEAFKLLNKKREKITLLIIGQIYDDPIKKYLKNLPDEIKFINVVKNPYSYYAIADLVVLPSRVDPFPYVMLEAGLMHKPFVGAKTGGIEEFIIDGKNGILFEPGNLVELSNKIKYLLDNPKIAESLADNLNTKVKERTSAERYISQLKQIYEDLLAS